MPKNCTVFFPNEVNFDDLVLGRPQIHNARGDWSASLTYKNDMPLRFQTPWMSNVFGLSKYPNSNQKTAYSLSFELRRSDQDIDAFYKFLTDLDDAMKEKFKKADIDGEYLSCIRPTKREPLPDTLRLKLKTKSGEFDLKFKENEKIVPWKIDGPELVEKRDICRMVLELMPVWHANNKTGISLKVVTLQKKSNPDFRFACDPNDVVLEDKPCDPIDLNA